ncbi:toxin biosynthesis protein [Bipolaris maydis]|nr:toxin biosynthesis protein [Bipolaris maydis]
MPLFPFEMKEHIFPCQHIRGYPRCTAHEQEEPLHLSVKQYIPHDNHDAQPSDITIIGTHAQGFSKEVYEPLWADMHGRLKSRGDVANQGASGVLDKYKLGNEPCVFNHARDLLDMVNTFRDQIIRPIVGIGHSARGPILVSLALLQPRLVLETLILIDPIIHRHNKYYSKWDERVLQRWLQYGLRNLPTAVYPRHIQVAGTEAHVTHEDASADTVTLTTTKHQEVFTFLRPTFDAHAYPGLGVESTGVGIGGSGGAAKGWVAEVTVQGVGHLIPTEAVGETADPSVEWLGNEMAAWREKEIVERSEWAYIPDEQKRTISDQYIEALRGETKSDTARLSRL